MVRDVRPPRCFQYAGRADSYRRKKLHQSAPYSSGDDDVNTGILQTVRFSPWQYHAMHFGPSGKYGTSSSAALCLRLRQVVRSLEALSHQERVLPGQECSKTLLLKNPPCPESPFLPVPIYWQMCLPKSTSALPQKEIYLSVNQTLARLAGAAEDFASGLPPASLCAMLV
jgi:hypothetical protein